MIIQSSEDNIQRHIKIHHSDTPSKSTFNVQISHQIPTYTSPIPDNCDEHLSCKPEWIQQLI